MSAIKLRVMTAHDLPFADSLRALAGWNQTLLDWRRFLALDPCGSFIAECDGSPAGTATTIRYGDQIAWIGMVLVHPNMRRRGIGRALLLHCIDYLKSLRVHSIKLDATPQGQELYQTLGFETEWTLTRWRGSIPNGESNPIGAIDARTMSTLDARAFGANRSPLIEKLSAECKVSSLAEEGFAMLRAGARALHLGPVVATSAKAASRLMDSLLTRGDLIMDIPDRNHPAVSWARSKGLRPERALTRMRLGAEVSPAAPDTLFAIAAPELG